MTNHQYHQIPEELRALPQWILWRYENNSKVPYSINGKKASVTDDKCWSSFIECFNCLALGNYNGLGFVFTDNDPYTFIDLDDAEGDETILARQLKIYHEFDSYSEVSVSGKGLHIIVKGKIGAGRRRSKIEIYSNNRYAVMTGNVYGGKTIINERQGLLTQLYDQMGSGPTATQTHIPDKKEEYSDDEILQRASSAVNGDKFAALHAGRWQDLYQSQSEADFAYIDMLAFYTQNRLQIERLFRQSALGKRDKAKRKDYVGGMIARSFDRQLPPIDFDGMKDALETKLKNGHTHDFTATGLPNGSADIANHSVPLDTPLILPTGLLGEIASFIYQAAPRPVPEVALAAAIGLMAGVCGRAYNISGTGLNQYVLLLAMTGAGKEAAASGINKLMNAVNMQVHSVTNFIGPSEIASGAALFKYLALNQSFISMLGEFGLRLQQMSSPNANGAEVSLRRMFLDLYNKSGFSETLHPSVYSDKANNTSAVSSPSFSIMGESTPERFYATLNEDMISEGLLPRFLMIEYKGKRPPLNEHHTEIIPNFSLIEKLGSLVAQSNTVNNSNPRRIINVDRTPEAARLLNDFDKYADNFINGAYKEVIRQLWNRAHVKVLKLSALVAVGDNMASPIITPDHVHWAATLVQADIAALTERFEAGLIGSNTHEVKQAQEIIRMIKDYNTGSYTTIAKYIDAKCEKLHVDKIIPYSYLSRRLIATASFRLDKAGSTIAIKRAIQNLVDTDRIKELGKVWTSEKYGTSQRCFVVHDLTILD
jgi:hypothetical protein